MSIFYSEYYVAGNDRPGSQKPYPPTFRIISITTNSKSFLKKIGIHIPIEAPKIRNTFRKENQKNKKKINRIYKHGSNIGSLYALISVNEHYYLLRNET